MAKYEDYVKQVQNEGGINEEIKDAAQQQTERQRDPNTGQFVADSTPEVDWERRYKELERLNSRQAQTLGEYRKTIDEFIVNPTPETANTSKEALSPITVDDLYDDPNAAVLRAVESHPAIREARELKDRIEQDRRQADLDAFVGRHGDYQDIASSPEFQNWVADNQTRMELFQRGNQYDFSAADALFSLYKAERGLNQRQAQDDLAAAELVSGTSEMPVEVPKYSRSEYINNLKRAKQGDLDAEDWVRTHAANYRNALATGNVRD